MFCVTERRGALITLVAIAISFPALVCAAYDLNDLIDASEINPSILAQQQMVRSAEAVTDSAKWQYYPTPSFSIQQVKASDSDPSYQGDELVYSFAIQQPLWTGGKLTAGHEKVVFEHKSAMAGLSEARQEIQLRTVQAYSDWLTAFLKTKASERNIVTHEKLYERINRRFKQGASAESDLTLALSRLQQAQADTYSANIQQEVALAQLGQLVGLTLTSESLKITEPKEIPVTAQSALDVALAEHPSIQKLDHLSKARFADIAVENASMYPDVFVRVEKQQGNFQFAGIESDARIFIGVQSKLGAGLSTLSDVQSAKFKHQSSLADIEKAKRNISEQILKEWANAHNLKRRLDVLKNALLSAERIQQAYDRQFVSGKKSWLDVMNAARELSQTENQLAETQGGLTSSSWKLSLYTNNYPFVLP
jgi:adhesin transport system outer membrane protein